MLAAVYVIPNIFQLTGLWVGIAFATTGIVLTASLVLWLISKRQKPR